MATCSDYNEENDAGKEEGGVIPDVEEKIKTPPNSPAREMPCSSSSSNVTTPRDKGARSRSTTSGRLLTPNPDGDDPDDFIDEAEILPKIYVSNKSYSYEERASLYCDEMIGPFSAEEVDEAISCYISDKLIDAPFWIAVWKTTPEVMGCRLPMNSNINDIPYVGVMVTVNCLGCDGKVMPLQVSASIAEPYSSNISNLPREHVEEILRKHKNSVSVLDVYPVEGQGPEVDSVAEALEHARFFFDFLWRHWDDDEEYEEYSGIIEKRIQLYYDIQDGTIPGPISERYRRTLEEYRNKRMDFSKLQSSIREDSSPGEAVECWKRYYELSLLSGLLKIWEDLRLRSHGPFYPRICKRRKGQRARGRKVTHMVAQMITTDMIQSFPKDVLIKQHETLSGALENCHSGDTVVIFPGDYKAVALASLTDDITIKGSGSRDEVVIFSHRSYDNFVTSKAAQVTLQNLTLVQCGTCDGIVVVESGHMTLDNCVLRCEGTGVCVLTGASLTMSNCEITGAQGAGVELYPGSSAELNGNEIHHCSNRCSKDASCSLGGIVMKVIPQPQLKLSNNHIHDNQGYGVSILMPDSSPRSSETTPECTASGDKSETDTTGDQLAKAIQNLSLETTTNKLEGNTMGDVGLLHKMWTNV
ncbi:testicular spindle-associated protein SHCBP1L-like [Engraulis encrasicolus]|uniref:testicular spindle-associated protein SHCBP1L-like n=1 Tax=Engraulis encrasicolus TaxID=184585 RepID=UPI002FD6A18F